MKMLYLIVGIIFNVILCFGAKKIIGNFNLLRFVVIHLPGFIGGMICYFLFISGGFVAAAVLLGFGRLAYTALQAGNILMLAKIVIIDIVCAFFLMSITSKLYQ